MKRYFKLIIVAVLFINISCDDWLDLKPANQVTEGELFSTSYGFRTALNGLYHKMSSTALYGKELSFAFVDVLSQQYDINSENMKTEAYLDLKDYKFDSKHVVPIVEDIWANAYNIIANANNIIAEIDKKNNDFFVKGEQEKNMIKGEALACRALMHFDLLRLFAPALVNDDNGSYIPYVDTYPTLRPAEGTVSDCMNSVIEDLKAAKELTMTFDTTDLGISTLCTGDGRFLGNYHTSSYLGEINEKSVNVFYKNRGYRLNYYAVTALLARAYQYANMHGEALKCAEEVISADWKKGKYFQFNTFGIENVDGITVWDKIIKMWDNKTNLRFLDNLIFACNNAKLQDDKNVIKHFYKTLANGQATREPNYFVINKERQNIFINSANDNESRTDVRSQYLLFEANEGATTISGKWYYSSNDQIRENNFNLIPMIRLTEMYYIAAESYARVSDFTNAKSLLETVRNERGCSASLNIESWDEFEKELINDARREWISEGQLFYLYKRLNAAVDFADGQLPRPLRREQAVVPVPVNQSL